MPLYEVWHSYPLTEAQRADLAHRITTIHTTLFTVPAAFVHVRFSNYAATEHYMAGKKHTGSINMVLGNVRQGPSRTHDLYESLCHQIEAAWTASVGDAATQGGAHARLTGAFVLGTVTAAYEQGFMAPEAGHDVQWMRESLPKFQALADDGNEFFQDMIAELRAREDFKFVFENGSA
ncbi:putative cis-3-chloroacrylic acid protein [Mycena venus]|uniref:Putative cis-3-chloroacrylic acid protein n=1 Tax=Mycena venus TaxID=2733690 RepID=A0A8H6YJ09_9AGAR|nr:putative cis-3-chloroacrylic acid protein [Mycena venus]